MTFPQTNADGLDKGSANMQDNDKKDLVFLYNAQGGERKKIEEAFS